MSEYAEYPSVDPYVRRLQGLLGCAHVELRRWSEGYTTDPQGQPRDMSRLLDDIDTAVRSEPCP